MSPPPDAQALSGSNEAYRAEYRAQEIPAGYRPGAHLLFTFGGGLAGLLACVGQLQAVQAREWLVLPAAFLYANLAEYLGHRYPMHRPFPGLGAIYRRHAGQHHRFFTDRSMPLGERRDVRAVLFPPSLVVMFFGGFGLPLWLLLDWAFSANVAWLALAVGVLYYMNYEFLHLAYHLPETSRIGRWPPIVHLRWLHQTHHDPGRMAKVNFNVSYPIMDRLLGTLDHGERR